MATIGANTRNRWQVSEGVVDLTRPRRPPRRVQVPARQQPIILDLARSAVVLVDLQNDFCTPGGWLDHLGVDTSPGRSTYAALNALLPVLRREDVPIVWLNWGNRPDRANLPPGVLHVYDPNGTGIGIGDSLGTTDNHVLERGSWSAALVDELCVAKGDLFVDKFRMTGFGGTDLADVLANLDVSTLLFGGVNLDQCVLATLTDAAALGYDCILLEDCSATTSPAVCTESTLYNVAQCFGFVTSGAALLAAIERGGMAQEAGGTRFEIGGLSDATSYRISPNDDVRLTPLHLPDSEHDVSVFLEIWGPGGSQPPNSHPQSTETFLFIDGQGEARCDGERFEVRAGQYLLLRPGSLHQIANTGDRRLYAITTMAPDDGFADFVTHGTPVPLDTIDFAALNTAAVTKGAS